MPAQDRSLLSRVAKCIGDAKAGSKGSIFKQSASYYGAKSIIDEVTVPTGFDPRAAVLFEAVVEAAFLTATCDGTLDAEERAAFESVVAEACDNAVQVAQVDALLRDLEEQLADDGFDHRLRVISKAISRRDHQQEVLRIATLIAHISGGVSPEERSVLERLAAGFHLPSGSVEAALLQVEQALAGESEAAPTA